METWAYNLAWNLYKVGKALARRHRGDRLLAGYKKWKGDAEVRA